MQDEITAVPLPLLNSTTSLIDNCTNNNLEHSISGVTNENNNEDKSNFPQTALDKYS